MHFCKIGNMELPFHRDEHETRVSRNCSNSADRENINTAVAFERDITAAVCNVSSFCELVLWKFEKYLLFLDTWHPNVQNLL